MGNNAFKDVLRYNVPTALTLIVGAASAGAIATIEMFMMGFHLGILSNLATDGGLPFATIIKMTAPHAVTEYFGFAILGSVEYDFGYAILIKLRKDVFRINLGIIITKVLTGMALILVSAAIEAYVTPRIFGQ